MKGTIVEISKTLRSHLDDCLQERRSAAQQRHDLRETLVKKIDANTHATLAGAGAVILILLSVSGFLFVKAMGW
jgi:hypothetical protein